MLNHNVFVKIIVEHLDYKILVKNIKNLKIVYRYQKMKEHKNNRRTRENYRIIIKKKQNTVKRCTIKKIKKNKFY